MASSTRSITNAEDSTPISPIKIQSPSTPSPPLAPISTTGAAYRVWVGAMGRDVTTETLMATFSRFGTLSGGIRLRTDLTHRLGSEAVITFIDEQDAARALSAEDVGEYRVYINWYEQREWWSLLEEDH